MAEQFPERELELGEAVEKVIKEEVRKLILDEGMQPDGRKLDEIRPLVRGCGLAAESARFGHVSPAARRRF